ncbi:MAG: hypothetical protein Q9188_000329 [Gyalolechia gomerana]
MTDVMLGDTLEDVVVTEDEDFEVIMDDEVLLVDKLEPVMGMEFVVDSFEVIVDVEEVVVEIMLAVDVTEVVVVESLDVVNDIELMMNELVVLELLDFIVVVKILLEEDKVNEVDVDVRVVVEEDEGPSQGLASQPGAYRDES